MSKKRRRFGENAHRALTPGSSLENVVGVSGFAHVAEPPVKVPEKPVGSPSYEPESDPEPSGNDCIPPGKRRTSRGWMYAAGGLAGLAVLGIGLYALAVTATPPPTPVAPKTPGPTVTYTPKATVTPVATSTPTISLYRKQASEKIAAIGQHETDLATMLTEQVIAMDDASVKSLIQFDRLNALQKIIADGNYSIETLTDGTNKTYIVATSTNEFRRTSMLQVIKASIPTIEQFLGINYKQPLLIVDLDNAESRGGGGKIIIQSTDWTLRNKTHEAGHEVWQVYPYKTGILTLGDAIRQPEWLTEGIAEFAGIYAASKLPQTLPGLESLMASPEWTGKDKTVPDFETWSKNSVNIIDTMNSRGETVAAPMTKGYVLLHEFLQLVGQDAFAKAMGGLHNVEVGRAETVKKYSLSTSDTKRTTIMDIDTMLTITNTDIETILAQYVPQDKLPQFNQLYQSRVYGLRDTSQ